MKYNHYRITLFALALLFGTTFGLFAQDNEDEMEKLESYAEMQYLKLSDGNKQFTIAFTFDGEEDTEPLKNIPVLFYTGFDEIKMIAEMNTNEDGKAILQISNDYVLPVNEEGYFYVKAVFEGNKKFEGSESEVSYIEITMDLSLEEVEGEKNIVVHVFRFNPDGEKEAVSDEDVFIYTPRMFNRLRIGEGYLEEGKAIIKFPVDLPGDTIGKITLIAKLEEHADFGNVEAMAVTDWGIPNTTMRVSDHRALWTQIAPTWMIITLTILLAGVWGHYGYAVYQLIKIKKNV